MLQQVFYYSTNLFITTGLSGTHAKYATIGIGIVMVIMTLISIPLMDRSGRRTLHLYGLGGMFIFSIFITISFLVKVTNVNLFLQNTLETEFAGISILDLVAICCFYFILRSIFCGGAGKHTLDDNGRTFFTGPKTCSNVRCCFN